MKKSFIACAMFMGATFASIAQANSLVNALTADTCHSMTLESKDKNVLLKPASQNAYTIFFIKNNAAKSIWLDHPTHKTANAGWSSYLRPNNWSALLLDTKTFEMSCATIEPGKVNYLVCKDALQICAPSHIAIKTAHKGSYWLVEDKSWQDLLKGLIKRKVNIAL